MRKILDDAGLHEISIFASGSLDETRLEDLLDSPINGFGIGTSLVTSGDCPWLDCAYKLQEYAGRPCRKRSEGKATWPGRKQVFRNFDSNGKMNGDVLTLDSDNQEGEALIIPVMKEGKRLEERIPLQEIRQKTLENYETLPDNLKRLEFAPYSVEISDLLTELAESVDRRGITSL